MIEPTDPTQPHFHRVVSSADPYATSATPDAVTEQADAELLAEVQKLTAQVGKLAPEVATLKIRGNKTWSWLKGGIGFIAFDIVVTLAGIVFGVIVLHTADQTAAVARQNAVLIAQVTTNQTKLNTTVHEFCGLYGSFIGFYSTKARDAFVGGPTQYDELYKQLLTSSKDLQCNIPVPVGLQRLGG